MQHFTASDGARIAYQDKGAGQPLVLLHGLMAHGGFFDAQDALSANFRLIVIDLRCHGQSRLATDGATVDRLAEDVSELVASLDLRDAIGLGWSLGASVLWQVLTGPEAGRFAGAIVVDMTPRVRNQDDWTLGLSQEACEARAQSMRSDFRTFATNAGANIFAQPLNGNSAPLAAWAGEQFAANDGATIEKLWNSLVQEDFRTLLRHIHQPTLVIHGAKSQLYGPETADHLVAALPNATALRFELSGHAPQIEQPELFNRAIQEFAASLPRVREARTSI